MLSAGLQHTLARPGWTDRQQAQRHSAVRPAGRQRRGLGPPVPGNPFKLRVSMVVIILPAASLLGSPSFSLEALDDFSPPPHEHQSRNRGGTKTTEGRLYIERSPETDRTAKPREVRETDGKGAQQEHAREHGEGRGARKHRTATHRPVSRRGRLTDTCHCTRYSGLRHSGLRWFALCCVHGGRRGPRAWPPLPRARACAPRHGRCTR